MADLPTVAQRLNDIQIAANAVLSESVNRTYGSNINYLLDLLDVTDGDTTPGGDSIGDLFAAVTLISNHTMDLQVTISSSGLTSVGTFTMTPFVNQVLIIRQAGAAGTLLHDPPSSAGSNIMDWRANIDATGLFILEDAVQSTQNEAGGVGHDDTVDSGTSHANLQSASPDANKRKGTRAINKGEYTLASGELVEAVELDWRDGSSIAVSSFSSLPPGTLEIYRSYRFSIESGIF